MAAVLRRRYISAKFVGEIAPIELPKKKRRRYTGGGSVRVHGVPGVPALQLARGNRNRKCAMIH